MDRLQKLAGEVKDREFLALQFCPAGMGLAYTAARMARRRFTALILFATCASCGGGDGGKPDSAVTPADAWVELGTGTTSFEEVGEDSDQVLVAGPQGGHHFILTAKMHGLQPGDPANPGTVYNPSTRFSVWSEAGDQLDVAPPPYHLGYEEMSDGVYALPGGHIIQVREEEVDALYGGRVKLRVELEDSNGAKVTDERWVVPIVDPLEPGGDAGVPDGGTPAVFVEIGTADAEGAFEAIAAESDLVIHPGIQGGHHFFLHARMQGLVPEGATTSFRIFKESGQRIDISGAYQLDYEPAGGELFALPFAPTVQFDEAEVEAIEGTRVRVVVALTDTDGIQVTDQRWVTAVAP